MAIEGVFTWVLVLALCEVALATSVSSVVGGAGVIVITLCGWLTRLDLDLLAILLGATYGSVLVCLSLVQSSLESYPGLAAHPLRATKTLSADLSVTLVFGGLALASEGVAPFSTALTDLPQGEGDWVELVIGVFHIFFYKVAAFEAFLLNIFLLLALVASLAIMGLISIGPGSNPSHVAQGLSRIRLLRSFRRQVRRKNTSQLRFNKG